MQSSLSPARTSRGAVSAQTTGAANETDERTRKEALTLACPADYIIGFRPSGRNASQRHSAIQIFSPLGPIRYGGSQRGAAVGAVVIGWVEAAGASRPEGERE